MNIIKGLNALLIVDRHFSEEDTETAIADSVKELRKLEDEDLNFTQKV